MTHGTFRKPDIFLGIQPNVAIKRGTRIKRWYRFSKQQKMALSDYLTVKAFLFMSIFTGVMKGLIPDFKIERY